MACFLHVAGMPRNRKESEVHMATRIVSIINLKGGVGKSTLAMILAEFLAEFPTHVGVNRQL